MRTSDPKISLERELPKIELFAWLGEDELGSGTIGIKQAKVPAGVIPLGIDFEKLSAPYIAQAMQVQSEIFRREIRLCRFVFSDSIISIYPPR